MAEGGIMRGRRNIEGVGERGARGRGRDRGIEVGSIGKEGEREVIQRREIEREERKIEKSIW
jgi:hypothetical protein